MKASLKLQEQEPPLLRAKIPFNFLSLPIRSGITLGSDLSLHVSTFSPSGPSFQVTFLPENPQNPVSIRLRAGLGKWGSPIESPLVFSAEFKLQKSPNFSLFIRPNIGDFTLSKNVRDIQMPVKEIHREKYTSCELQRSSSVAEIRKAFEEKVKVNDALKEVKLDELFTERDTLDYLKCWNLHARTSVSVGRVCVRQRWRMDIPRDFLKDTHRLFSVPLLSLDKVKLEMIHEDRRIPKRVSPPLIKENQELDKVTDMCSSIKRQMRVVYTENQVLKNTMEEMKASLNVNQEKKSLFKEYSLPHFNEEQQVNQDDESSQVAEELKKAIVASGK